MHSVAPVEALIDSVDPIEPWLARSIELKVKH